MESNSVCNHTSDSGVRFTVQIGQHEVLLPINHNFNKIWSILPYWETAHLPLP